MIAAFLLMINSPAYIAEHCKPEYMRVYNAKTDTIETTTYDLNATKCEYLKTTRNGFNPKRALDMQRDFREMRRHLCPQRRKRHANRP